jgi:hypothetical protein
MKNIILCGLFILFSGCTILIPEFDYSVNETSSREVIVTLNFSNYPNQEVIVEQVSQDFLYNIGDLWDAPSIERGNNVYNVYLDWDWGELEPVDDEFDWSLLYEDYGLNDAVNSENSIIRLGVISTNAWIYGTWGSEDEAGYPNWVDASNISLVQEEYLEFVGELIEEINFTPNFYMIEVELNALANHAGLTNAEAIDWLRRLTSKIKIADSNALVGLDIASQNL